MYRYNKYSKQNIKRLAKFRKGEAKKRVKRLRKNIKCIKYWDKIERRFSRETRETFSMHFKHESYMDNENRIEYIAKLYGYEITEEKLTSKYSYYTFKKI